MKPSSALWMLTLLSCAFLISHVSAAEKNPSAKALSQTEEKSQPDIQKDKSKDQNPPAEPISQKTPEPKKHPEPQKPQKHWYDFFSDTTMPNWLIIAGWALASFIASRTLRSLNKQVKANVDSANAATRANEIANTTLEMSRRARISIKDVKFVERRALPTIEYILVNTGELPATGVFRYPMRSEMEPRLLNHAHPPNPVGAGEIIDPHSEAKHSWRLTIPQGGKQPIITAEELRQIVDGNFDLLIGICVSYWDGFGNARLSESWHTYNLPKSRWERVTIHQS
jgi:hypothetical protein